MWLDEYLVDFPGKQDVLRYVLTANAPETKDNNFTWKDFQARNNNELVAVYGNFVNRALVLTDKYYGGVVPEQGELTDYDRQTISEFTGVKADVEKLLDEFRFRDAQKEAMNLARIGNKYLADSEPWKLQKTDPKRVETILNLSLQLVAKINKPELLFEKIDDAPIQAQVDKLLATKAANEAAGRKAEPQKADMPFENFEKMDLRVGTVKECVKVEKSDKLLRFVIDDGLETRTIVSGIAKFYKPEELVGKQVCFIANLPPRKLRGIESQGMILSAENPDGTLSVLTPDRKCADGACVK